MMWRRLTLIRAGLIVVDENLPHPFVPHMHKIKHFSFRSLKRFVDITIIITLRFYVRFVNFVKNQYSKLRIKIMSMSQENPDGNGLLKKEANKVLKVLSEYKNKISRMKKNIYEEEKNM
jgi:hypothetical protein